MNSERTESLTALPFFKGGQRGIFPGASPKIPPPAPLYERRERKRSHTSEEPQRIGHDSVPFFKAKGISK
ncbi:MAG: hypothetical protein B6245_14155 [Desulfobacteraceae bacterium 4572_88]|nr:MAG: hypothetical protein B6245_14155 [Desulfobacteraceae bacterium 4572_88]